MARRSTYIRTRRLFWFSFLRRFFLLLVFFFPTPSYTYRISPNKANKRWVTRRIGKCVIYMPSAENEKKSSGNARSNFLSLVSPHNLASVHMAQCESERILKSVIKDVCRHHRLARKNGPEVGRCEPTRANYKSLLLIDQSHRGCASSRFSADARFGPHPFHLPSPAPAPVQIPCPPRSLCSPTMPPQILIRTLAPDIELFLLVPVSCDARAGLLDVETKPASLLDAECLTN